MKHKSRKRRRLLAILMIILIAIVSLITSFIYMFESRLSDIIDDMAENTVKAKAGKIISTVICDEIEKDGITYDKLVTFEKDHTGQITALKTNIIEVNRLKSKISVKILEALEQMDTAELEIQFGTVIGGDLLGGKGPTMKINVIPVGSVETEIHNEIFSAGINQSRHQIMMLVKADLTIITSIARLKTEVETYICIAETVIVGDVPNSYTNINTSRNA